MKAGRQWVDTLATHFARAAASAVRIVVGTISALILMVVGTATVVVFMYLLGVLAPL